MKRPRLEEERNQKLIADYKAGMAMHKMNGKYEISSPRIYQILNRYEVPRRTKKQL